MQTKWIDTTIDYDGSQLAPHFIYKNFNISGDALIAFAGKCDVNLQHMVDIEDVKNKQTIFSPHMLHFIGEFFHKDLITGVMIQRLLIVIIKEQIEKIKNEIKINRVGDDLFINDGKLTVSIATVSCVSVLIHVGININDEGTPVKTECLERLKISFLELSENILKSFSTEFDSILFASCKARPVY